ncbi:MAG: MerR family transcriptional regulator [Proteobacteria bacterium]|nr:MerR family transcriptional regulator [Pseudomonadota bacterium]
MNTDAAGTLITIGAVAQATGIPANTLRTWERRYGFPAPTRTGGGQRVYDPSVVDHLRLVRVALDRGHRAKQALSLTADELHALVGGRPVVDGPHGAMEAWQRAVRDLDGPLFSSLLRQERSKLGALTFLTSRVGPFLKWIGDAWSGGQLEIHQEHFAADHIRSTLDETWRALSPPGRPQVICATLPGEPHDLGVLMAAVAVATAGLRPLVLPGQTPANQIVASARTVSARAVAISLSDYSAGHDFELPLRSLRESLPPNTALWIGGSGAPEQVQGALTQRTLEDLATLA